MRKISKVLATSALIPALALSLVVGGTPNQAHASQDKAKTVIESGKKVKSKFAERQVVIQKAKKSAKDKTVKVIATQSVIGENEPKMTAQVVDPTSPVSPTSPEVKATTTSKTTSLTEDLLGKVNGGTSTTDKAPIAQTDLTEAEATSLVEKLLKHTLKAQKEALDKLPSYSYTPVLDKDGNIKDEKGKELTHAEAEKVNPFHYTNVYSNKLILDAVKSGDWSEYNEFQAMKSPLFYDLVGGKFVQNKFYYVQFLESASSDYREVSMGVNAQAIKDAKARVEQWIVDFKKAPGTMIPYIVGINSHELYAKEWNFPTTSDEFWNSKYNNDYIMTYGKTEEGNPSDFFFGDHLKDKVATPTTTTPATTTPDTTTK